MLKSKFDPRQCYQVVIYARMSSDRQNPRSPDQQIDEIRRRMERLGLTWVVVKVYRDDAVSGKYQRRRSGFQKMLADIRTGVIKADLILVDTSERIGRNNEVEPLRNELRDRHGVLLLTAMNDFADPTTPQGQVYSAFETLRATEENRTKAHQVVRGKRDLARQGYWPGAPEPFGFRLEPVIVVLGGRQVVAGCRLVPDPVEASVVFKAFLTVRDTGAGQAKVARLLNADPEIPAGLKPFYGSTVGYWLDAEIYKGVLVWNQHATGVVNDTRVVEPNPADEVLRVPGFCAPVVPEEVWDAVARTRAARRESLAAAKARKAAAGNAGGAKLLEPVAPGMTLKYLLTGLVKCGLCGSAMRPAKSGRAAKCGTTYCYYVCPRSTDGTCENRRSVPEAWLRQTVVGRVRETLFPTA